MAITIYENGFFSTAGCGLAVGTTARYVKPFPLQYDTCRELRDMQILHLRVAVPGFVSAALRRAVVRLPV